MNFQNYIEVNPKILMGKPVIKGTRISNELIVEKLAAAQTENEVILAHPHITMEHIKAALAFAALL
jgi:uncharacterized protein (DUF433 family)